MFGDTRRIYFQLIEQSDIENYTMLLNLRNRNREHMSFDHVYPKVEFEDWKKEMLKNKINSSTINKLILENFIKKGMKDTAKIFAEEAGIDLDLTVEVKIKNLFNEINNLLNENKINELSLCLKKVDQDFFKKNRNLYLKIKFLELSDLKNFEEIQKYVFEEIMPILDIPIDDMEREENIDVLENYLTEFLLKKRLDHKKKEVFDEIKEILQKHYKLNNKNSLNQLLKILYTLQEEIGNDTGMPILVDKKFTKKTKLFQHPQI